MARAAWPGGECSSERSKLATGIKTAATVDYNSQSPPRQPARLSSQSPHPVGKEGPRKGKPGDPQPVIGCAPEVLKLPGG